MLFALVATVAKAQTGFVGLGANVDESVVQGVVVAPAADNGILVGTINDGVCNITRLDGSGTVEWSRAYEIDLSARFTDILDLTEIDEGPACYFLALKEDYDPTSFDPRYVLVELNEDHEVVFSQEYYDSMGVCGGGAQGAREHAYRRTNGGYLISLPTNSNFSCLYGVNAIGDTLFTRLFSVQPGAFGTLSGVGSLQLQDGSLLLLNTSTAEWSDLQMMRIDENGEYIWSKTYQMDYLYSLAISAVQTSGDSVVVVGIHGSQWGTDYVGFILKMDLDGNIDWHRRYAIPTGQDLLFCEPKGIAIGASGDYFVPMGSLVEPFIAKFNAQGIQTGLVALTPLVEPNSGGIDELRLVASDQGSLIVAESALFFGWPENSDSLMVAYVADLSDLLCMASPRAWFDEPDPSVITVVDGGAVSYSQWFRSAPVPLTTSTTTWTLTPLCTTTSVPGLQAQHPTGGSLIAFCDGNTVQLHGGDLHLVHCQIISTSGTLVREASLDGRSENALFVGDLVPGIYLIRLRTTDGTILGTRFVVPN